MRLDILFGGWLQAPNGAASVVKSLQDHSNLFEKEGVDVFFYSLDNLYYRDFNYSYKAISIYRKIYIGLRNFIKKYLNKYSRKILFLAKQSVAHGMDYSKEVALNYLQNAKDGSCVLIHDLFTCYFYLLNRKQYQPTFLVLHNNGDTFSMHLEYYPCLKGTKYLNKLKEIERYVLGNVDKVIFVAKQPMDYFLELHPYMHQDKVTFVHNGIEWENIDNYPKHKLNKKLEIVTIGSVSTRKGQDIIVDALKALNKEQLSKVHITIVGDGPIKAELEQTCQNENLPVTFVGYSKDVQKYLAQSDIFLLPSRDEGFPISILEAERAGLPVISTKVAGIPEMIRHGISGILINPKVEDLKQIFQKLHMYDWYKMGLESRINYEKQFTIDKMISSYVSILDR